MIFDFFSVFFCGVVCGVLQYRWVQRFSYNSDTLQITRKYVFERKSHKNDCTTLSCFILRYSNDFCHFDRVFGGPLVAILAT